ncbi:transposase [Pontiella sp.]|uniref:REP-associated tyrosine transposase n=1 Tax=Pontiella sp. TaxID=2837462 RepID=UPI00356AE7D7
MHESGVALRLPPHSGTMHTFSMSEGVPYWPHAPMHCFDEQGVYMVTAGTYRKHRLFNSPEKLSMLRDMLFKYAEQFEWRLQAWAILNNHYHFIAVSPADASTLKSMLSRLHEYSAKKLNRMEGVSGRKVWHNYWESHITHQTSYFARLRYVHQNPVHHGVVQHASNYEWCSQAWLERNAERSFVNTLARFKTDRIRVQDDF